MALIAGLVVANMLPRDDPELRRALISSHVRTLQADHRSDGLADGDRLLAPWLAARIGLALPVVDLEADGYPLVDTRSDTVGDHAAAVFVYRARDHVINVFVWADPSSEDELTPGAWSAEGYSVCHWRRREAAFFAVSDLSADQVNAFEQLYKMRHRSLARRLRVGMIG